jgi:HxlR-like helix-turn-helix protein
MIFLGPLPPKASMQCNEQQSGHREAARHKRSECGDQRRFVERIAHPVVPPHVEYRLTPLGVGIARRIAALTRWIEGRIPEILAVRERTNKLRNGGGG